jgi:hypothetical protein
MHDDDEAFRAFERGVRARSVLDVEHERMNLGHPPDVALQKHGADLEDQFLRMLEQESESLHARHGTAEVLSFPSNKKSDCR